MRDIIVGCVTRLPNPLADRYFNMEMSVDNYPTKEDRQELVDFLQPHINEIVDDVVYIIDTEWNMKIWEITDENIKTSRE
ncbi:MAG: hypothetical protein DRP58_13095 [Spirochaetes bacterium]|nr:MAG: hypothetical protein DRP58_13095 [Spirochaetota bacterium]